MRLLVLCTVPAGVKLSEVISDAVDKTSISPLLVGVSSDCKASLRYCNSCGTHIPLHQSLSLSTRYITKHLFFIPSNHQVPFQMMVIVPILLSLQKTAAKKYITLIWSNKVWSMFALNFLHQFVQCILLNSLSYWVWWPLKTLHHLSLQQWIYWVQSSCITWQYNCIVRMVISLEINNRQRNYHFGITKSNFCFFSIFTFLCYYLLVYGLLQNLYMTNPWIPVTYPSTHPYTTMVKIK